MLANNILQLSQKMTSVSVSACDVMNDHPRLDALVMSGSVIGNRTVYNWVFDFCVEPKYHALSKRWLVRLACSDLQSFTWWVDLKFLLRENQIDYCDSSEWRALFLSKISYRNGGHERRISLVAAQTCAALAVRNLPDYPVSFV